MVLERSLRGKVGDGERLYRQDTEGAFDLVQPRRARGRVMKMNARVITEPGADVVSESDDSSSAPP
jgi:hypothetical protein